MTEIERIIKKGVISEDFLKEEVKCDFHITADRKKLWTVLLDLFIKFDEVCKKHNLHYYMIGGTLLGAVRHKGFIPWDDDIDLGMPRDDYEKFIKLQNEFSSPYFLQTPYTDPGYGYSFAKIRNSNTTGVVELFMYQKFNHGIWISVFPLDKWSDVGGEEKYNCIKHLIRENSTYMRKSNPNLTDADRERVANYSHRDPLDVHEEIQRVASSCKDKNPLYISHATCTVNSYRRNFFFYDDFKTSVLGDFEGFKFPMPVGYERMLSMAFGNYMEFPPIEKRGNWHSAIFNTDIPYTEYIKSRIND